MFLFVYRSVVFCQWKYENNLTHANMYKQLLPHSLWTLIKEFYTIYCEKTLKTKKQKPVT